MQMAAPVSGVEGMVEGVPEEQFRELYEQSRAWAAFADTVPQSFKIYLVYCGRNIS